VPFEPYLHRRIFLAVSAYYFTPIPRPPLWRESQSPILIYPCAFARSGNPDRTWIMQSVYGPCMYTHVIRFSIFSQTIPFDRFWACMEKFSSLCRGPYVSFLYHFIFFNRHCHISNIGTILFTASYSVILQV